MECGRGLESSFYTGNVASSEGDALLCYCNICISKGDNVFSMYEIICKNYYVITILIVICGMLNYRAVVGFMRIMHLFLKAGMEAAGLELKDDRWDIYRYLALVLTGGMCLLEAALIIPLIVEGAHYAHFVTFYYALQYANIAANLAMMYVLVISYLFKRLPWSVGIAKYRKIFNTAMFVSAISIMVLLNLSFWVD